MLIDFRHNHILEISRKLILGGNVLEGSGARRTFGRNRAGEVIDLAVAVVFREIPFQATLQTMAKEPRFRPILCGETGECRHRPSFDVEISQIQHRQIAHIMRSLLHRHRQRVDTRRRHGLFAVEIVRRIGKALCNCERRQTALFVGSEDEGVVERECVIVRFVEIDGVVDGQVGVIAVALKCAGIAQRRVPRQFESTDWTFQKAPQRTGHTLVVFTRISRVNLRIEIVGRHVDCPSVGGHPESFAHIEQPALHIGLEAGFKVAYAIFALDVDHARRDFAVFHRRNAADHLDCFNVVGRDGAHIHSFAHSRALGVVARLA